MLSSSSQLPTTAERAVIKCVFFSHSDVKSEGTTPNGEHLLSMDKVVFHFLIILSKEKHLQVLIVLT